MSANSILWVIAIVVVLVIIGLWILNSRKGKISILLLKKSFHDAETINGKVLLTVKKPLNKTGPLIVELNCDEIQSQRNASGQMRTSTHRLVHEQVVLDNQSSMIPGEKSYDFQINIPSMANSPKMMKDSFMGSSSGKKLRWTLSSSLEIPGLNISNSEHIDVF